MTFGSRLKKLRGKQSRKDFAELVGSHENTIGNYERDTRTPDITFVSNVCNVTGASLDWLVSGEGAMFRDEATDQATDQAQPNQNTACPRCERLENDNRALMVENRELTKQLLEVTRENGDLRVELERMKARATPDEDKPNEAHRNVG